METDEGEYKTRASLISIANGPMTGANLRLAPDSLLNDHKLTISIYSMSRWEILTSLFHMRLDPTRKPKHLKTIQTKSVSVASKQPISMHADATIFGETPATLSVYSSALSVICGYPAPEEPPAMKASTVISP